MNEITRKVIQMIGETYPISYRILKESADFYHAIYGDLTETDYNAARLWVSRDEQNKELFIEIAKSGILNGLLLRIIEVCDLKLNGLYQPFLDLGAVAEVTAVHVEELRRLLLKTAEIASGKPRNRNTKRQFRKSSRVI